MSMSREPAFQVWWPLPTRTGHPVDVLADAVGA
jgi:hypothetical protein